MVPEFMHDTIWSSQVAAADTGRLIGEESGPRVRSSALPPGISPRGDRRGGAVVLLFGGMS